MQTWYFHVIVIDTEETEGHGDSMGQLSSEMESKTSNRQKWTNIRFVVLVQTLLNMSVK